MLKKRLLKRSDYATLAGVSPAAITKACALGGALHSAIVGRLVDSGHPAAVRYAAAMAVPRPGTVAEADPIYAEAMAACFESGRWSTKFLRDRFAVGGNRADRLLVAMRAAGIVPVKGAAAAPMPTPAPVPTPPTPTPTAAPTPPPAPVPTSSAPTPPPTPAPLPSVEFLARDYGPTPRGHRARARSAEPFGDDGEANFLLGMPASFGDFLDWTLGDLIEKFGTDIRFESFLKSTKAIEDINEKRLKNAETRGELVSRELVKHGVIDPINAAHIKLLTDGAKTIARRAAAMVGAGRTVEEVEAFVAGQIGSFIRPMKAKIARALPNTAGAEAPANA